MLRRGPAAPRRSTPEPLSTGEAVLAVGLVLGGVLVAFMVATLDMRR